MTGVILITLVMILIVLVVSTTRGDRWGFGSTGPRSSEALYPAGLAAADLQSGLGATAAASSCPHLRLLLGTPAMALTDDKSLLHWDGAWAHHGRDVPTLVADTLRDGQTTVVPVQCHEPNCELKSVIVAPLLVDGRVVGTLLAGTDQLTPATVQSTSGVADWVGTQLAIGELSAARGRLAEAEVRALRAQISPHFIYNALTTISSFVRTDPERARELLTDFADFTRYSFRRHGEFTTLAEELRNIDRYLVLERARFGERLEVVLRIAPEVLPVAVPFLCLQPLVENAVKHGLEGRTSGGRIRIVAEDSGSEARIYVEDDGVGMDPAKLARTMAGNDSAGHDFAGHDCAGHDSVGIVNVDERLRATFGAAYGLVIETAPDAGTRVNLRIPKFAAGVRAT